MISMIFRKKIPLTEGERLTMLMSANQLLTKQKVFLEKKLLQI